MEGDHVDQLLEQWSLERPELDMLELSLVARVLRLEHFLERETSAVLDGFDLRIGESHVLATLRRSGPPYELTPTDLYRGLLLSSGAMTNRLDRLEERGLVSRLPDDDDQRRVRVALTDEGRALIDAAMDAQAKSLRASLAFLDDEDHAKLGGILRRILVEFEQDPPG